MFDDVTLGKLLGIALVIVTGVIIWRRFLAMRAQTHASNICVPEDQLQRAKQDLRESEERLRTVVESLPIVVYSADAGTNHPSLIRGAVKEIFGHDIEEVRKDPYVIQRLCHPDDAERVGQTFREGLASGKPFELESRIIRDTDGRTVWLQERVVPVLNEDGSLRARHSITLDITKHKQAEKTFRSVVEGTSGAVGEAFFETLVRCLASALECRYAMVAAVDPSNAARAESLAVWSGDGPINKFTYALAGTPCANVLSTGFCQYPENVQALFPEDRLLKDLNVESYLGMPLHNSVGEVIGLLVAMDTRPLVHTPIIRSLLQTFAARAGAELERIQAERELRTLEERFSMAFRASPNVVAISRLDDGTLIDVNEAFEKIFLVPRDAALGRTTLELGLYVDPGDRDAIRKSASEGASVRNRDIRFRRASGEVFDALYSGERIEIGDDVCLLSIITDVTEIKRSEDALRQSESRNRAILSAMPDLMFRLSREGLYLDFHAPSTEELFVEPQAILGRTVDEVMPENVASQYRQHIHETLAHGGIATFEYALEFPEEERRSYEARMVVSGMDEVLVIVRNITDRKRAELEKLQLQEQLHQAQKMEAVGELASGIAHDFNNLLTVITGNAELMQTTLPDGVARTEIEMIREAAAQASGVTRSLLTFSRKLPAVKRPIDLAETVEKTTRMLSRMLPASVKLVTELRRDGPTRINADATQIQQVVMNLAINARDAMPEGGVLTIRLLRGSSQRNGSQQDAPGDAPADDVRLVVSDTGTGMTPEVQARIFEPFFSTKIRGRGTGLGLAVIHGIVKEHGGIIQADSEVGQGSTFTVILPALAGEARIEGAGSPTAPLSGNGQVIAVAEDNWHVASLISTTLKSLNYKVICSGDGPSFMSCVRERGDEIDLFVLDVDIPGQTGLACLETLRAEGNRAPAIIVTGSVDTDVERLISGNTTLLRKPFEMSVLGNLVSHMLDLTPHAGQSPPAD